MDEDNHIATPIARRFVAELRSFEQDGDPSGLVRQFAEDAPLIRLDSRGARTDARAYWREYRAQFDSVSTTFRNAIETDTHVALEWDSRAVLAGGHPVTYSGVTVLDIDVGEDVIACLRTYYDGSAFPDAPTGG